MGAYIPHGAYMSIYKRDDVSNQLRYTTLATRLLEKGTPLPTIAEILGHTSLESTRIYAKADVEALRGVALDPEEVNHAS